jgi:hypothetical protein
LIWVMLIMWDRVYGMERRKPLRFLLSNAIEFESKKRGVTDSEIG